MKRKLVMITAYDYPTAKIAEDAGVDYILVGDSLGMVVLGYPDTKSVTMKDMLHHVKATARAVSEIPIIADMPIHTYDKQKDAVKNARLFLDLGAKMVKIEGNRKEIVQEMVREKIPVVGHLGLLPQTAEKYSVAGRDPKIAQQICKNAKELESAGISLLILECIPQDLAKKITEDLKIPTIGIGAGKYCDGQVLVMHDVIGLSDFQGKMVKKYADVKSCIKNAVEEFKKEVITGKFPGEENSFL